MTTLLWAADANAWEPLVRRKAKAKAEAAKNDSLKARTPYQKLFDKEQKSSKGLFDVHLKKGKVYLEIPDSLLGRAFASGTSVKSISNNSISVVGQKNLSDLSFFTIEKVDSVLLLRSLSFDFTSDEKNILEALSGSRTGAIVARFPSKAKSPSGNLVVDVTDFLLSDRDEFNPFKMGYGGRYKSNFKKDMSYIVDAKSFEDNVSITVSRSYSYSVEGSSRVKNRPFTAQTTTSILMLPDSIYHPRMADPRIGYFFTPRTQMGDMASTTRTIYFANRWRLEPSDTAAYRRGEKVRPVKPITFYIDNDFPEWWKSYIFDAVMQWNEPFEEIGFKDAVQALPFPDDDPAFDPDNIRYSCIRYAPVGIQNAMGPSWTDPRSGEIINASVYVYHDVIKLLTVWMFVQTAQADEAVRAVDPPKELLGDALMYVIKHEVGHTLGLMHNMSASTVIPVESLRDPGFTREYGTTTSIMDYARFNYVAQPGDKERGVSLTPPRFGKYDRYAIRWGYTPVFDAEDFAAESEITTRWITDSLAARPYCRYGKQQLSPIMMDPSCQTEDLGDDVFAATTYGISNLKYIMSRFMDWISDADDPEYKFRTDIYMGLVNQYLRYSGHMLANVEGLYKREVIAGDGFKRFANIPRDRQEKALEFAFNMIQDTDWMEDKAVLGRLPIAGSPVYQVRKAITESLMLSPFKALMADGVDTFEFSPDEVLSALEEKIWKPVRSRKALTSWDREMQRIYVESIMANVGFVNPNAKAALTEELPDTEGYMGKITYDEVSGFEWEPRAMLNGGTYTQGTAYAALSKVYKLMEQAYPSANDLDKGHYKLLMGIIDYGRK